MRLLIGAEWSALGQPNLTVISPGVVEFPGTGPKCRLNPQFDEALALKQRNSLQGVLPEQICTHPHSPVHLILVAYSCKTAQ